MQGEALIVASSCASRRVVTLSRVHACIVRVQDVALLFDRAKELRSQAMLSYLQAHVQQFYEHNMAKEAAALRAARVRLPVCSQRCCVAALVVAALCCSM
jgi:hypothetical protein